MNFKLEQEFSKADIIRQVDDLRKQIDEMRPLASDLEGKVMQKLRLDWNYHSNAIEGNRLSYGETIAFLMEGITAKGKSLKDHLDIRGHNEAISFLLSIVKDTRPMTESDIRALHKMILVEEYDVRAQTGDGAPTTKRITLGEYKTSANHVQTATGEMHYYATPEETPAKMQELMAWYNQIDQQADIHPVVVAALFHHQFVSIHPFDDGNGRLSRILMNLILIQKGYPPVVIKMNDRRNYYALLSRADNGDSWPFVEYIVESLIVSLSLFLKAARGGEIREEEDLEKEIALFKMDVKQQVTDDTKILPVQIVNLITNSILPIISWIISKIKSLDELFNKKAIILGVDYRILSDNTVTTSNSLVTDLEDLEKYVSALPGYRIESIVFSYQLFEFKNPKNEFNVTGTLTFKLMDYNYLITNNNTALTLLKAYNETITSEEKIMLARNMYQGIKKDIEQNLQ